MDRYRGSYWLIFFFFLCISGNGYGQPAVAITIDDVPNTGKSKNENFSSRLLEKLDSLNIPVAIFIVEGLIYKGDSISKNVELINQWISRRYTTLGYHSSKHSRYSEVGLDSFRIDVESGEKIVRQFSKITSLPKNLK